MPAMRMPSSIAAVLVALIAACSPAPSDGDSEERAPASADRRPHIVLIVCDTLRADHLDLHGYARSTAPLLRGWASTGMVYDEATAPSNWTRPSIQSLFTGRHPIADQIFHPGDRWRTDVHWLPELLQEAGYETVAATANLFLGADFGGSRGFDRHVHTEFDRAQPGHWKHLIAAEGLLTDLEGALTAPPLDDDRPVFLYVHLMEPHIPYDPPAEYRSWCPPDYDGPFDGRGAAFGALKGDNVDERLAAGDREQLIGLYDGEIRRMDDQLQRLRKMVAKHLGGRDVLTVLTADHGEAFGEGPSNRYTHGWGMGPELLHVPLVVHDGREHGRVSARVGLVDIFTTLMETADAELPDDIDGLPLRDAQRGREYVSYKALPGATALSGQLAVLRDDLRAERHDDGTWGLFRTDTGEDVTEVYPRVLRDMIRSSTRWARASRERLPDPEAGRESNSAGGDLFEKLKALGYADEVTDESAGDEQGDDVDTEPKPEQPEPGHDG